MSAPDFGPGDPVVCVDIGHGPRAHNIAGHRLKLGAFYRVKDVLIHPDYGEWVVRLAGHPNPDAPATGAFAAFRFRKIDKADDQFIELMRACRPAGVRA